jgi:hypothetical protein
MSASERNHIRATGQAMAEAQGRSSACLATRAGDDLPLRELPVEFLRVA